MSKTKFHNTNGDLTQYSFICGYIQEFKQNNMEVELYLDGVYHVRGYDRSQSQYGIRLFWESFDNLTDARKLYRKKVGEIKRSGYLTSTTRPLVSTF